MTHKKTDKERYIRVVANRRETRDQEKKERGVIISFTYCSNQIKGNLNSERNRKKRKKSKNRILG